MYKNLDLVAHYRQFFKMMKVENPQEKELAYQLRHQVFHQDCGFHELGSLSANQLEKDEYDDLSTHTLFLQKQTNQAIGYIRLIHVAKDGNINLPAEKYYDRNFDFSASSLDKLGNGNKCEISRMALTSSFRRRKSDLDLSDSPQLTAIAEIRRYPINYLPICLIFAVMHSMRKVNADHALAFVEKRLALFLGHFGVQYDQIGEPINCYGRRSPFILHLEATQNHLKPEFRKLFDYIGSELK